VNDSDPPYPTTGDLIGPSDDEALPAGGEGLRRDHEKLRKDYQKMFEEGASEAAGDPNRRDLVLINHGDDPLDEEQLMKRIGDAAGLHVYGTLAAAQQAYPLHIATCEFVIVNEPTTGLDQFREYQDRLVVIEDENSTGTDSSDVLRIVRPIDSAVNDGIFELLLSSSDQDSARSVPASLPASQHDIALPTLSEEEMSHLISEHETPVSASGDLQPDAMAAVKALLKARKDGVVSAEALRNWVMSDPAFLGWAELRKSGDEISVKVGGYDPGAVLRSIGDEMDVGEPIPTEPGSLGPFVGVPLPDAWLGFLARDPQAARREFFRAFQLLPLIDELVPALATDGKPLVEDPEQRFTRLLDTRIRAAERRGGAPGVLVLEHPRGGRDLAEKIPKELRGTDWVEICGDRMWVLIDQPEPGAAESLTRRLDEAIPGLRGGGIIGVSTGEVARECMERARQLLRGSDQLRIVDEMS
jgi:hypothetical protein